MSRHDVVVRYGLTTTVLADRFREHLAPLLPKTVQDARWQRTDYAWACTSCPGTVSVKWPTLDDAHQDAVAHAHEHGGARVEHAPAENTGGRP